MTETKYGKHIVPIPVIPMSGEINGKTRYHGVLPGIHSGEIHTLSHQLPRCEETVYIYSGPIRPEDDRVSL